MLVLSARVLTQTWQTASFRASGLYASLILREFATCTPAQPIRASSQVVRTARTDNGDGECGHLFKIDAQQTGAGLAGTRRPCTKRTNHTRLHVVDMVVRHISRS